ncbi:MAG: transposase [Verrucomicrobiales bacterium]|nr:transposase [Verrucomicrobiales bacterium]
MASHFTLQAPPGFRGLNNDEEIVCYRRHLPHWKQSGATYFVTFRLADSLPRIRLDELRLLREKSFRDATGGQDGQGKEEAERLLFITTERFLDQGMGDCPLREPRLRAELLEALHFADGERYELFSYVIMPNHVHLLLSPFEGYDLSRVLRDCKRYSARNINESRGQRGKLWQAESYDRIVRDAEHLWRCLQYIGKNANKAGLVDGDYCRWVRPEWEQLGWGFLD